MLEKGKIEGLETKTTQSGKQMFFIKINGKSISGFGAIPEGLSIGKEAEIPYHENNREGRIYLNYGAESPAGKKFNSEYQERKDRLMSRMSCLRAAAELTAVELNMNAIQKQEHVKHLCTLFEKWITTGFWEGEQDDRKEN